MSMILDALTRAEHERHVEKQPNLKFVTPIKLQKKKPNKVWLWAILAIIANIMVLAIFLRPNTGANEPTQIATNSTTHKDAKVIAQASLPTPSTGITTSADEAPISKDRDDAVREKNSFTEVRPLAMELNREASPQIDRPLIYEAEQIDISPQSSLKQNSAAEQSAAVSSFEHGAVSFSSTELTVNETTQQVANAPKLLIDEGDTDAAISNVPSLSELPASSRNDLRQYEVNVHVFDDNPERRFVLINMSKYKEGDRIAENGPLVQEITRAGVIVDYGNGRALLPPK